MRIDGSVSQDHRAIRVSDFQGNSDCRVALLSITACAEGITLTAANLVVFTELYWVPGVIEQAEARAHRVGQKDSVFCQYLLLPNSPDEVVYNMLEKKKKDTSTILDGVETGLVMGQSQTSDKDLADLIGDDSQWCPAPGEIPITKKLRLD
jgi:SNF2 family DNA or RNA helicase